MNKKRARQLQKKEKEIIFEKPKSLNAILKILYKQCKGRINGETKSFQRFKKQITEIFIAEKQIPIAIAVELTIGGKPIYCTITKYTWGYDYYIPETREAEEKLKKETGYYDT